MLFTCQQLQKRFAGKTCHNYFLAQFAYEPRSSVWPSKGLPGQAWIPKGSCAGLQAPCDAEASGWDPFVATRHRRVGLWLVPGAGGGALSRMPEPVRISRETIYTAIYAMPRGELRTEVIGLLRKSHKTRRPRARGEDRRGLIPNMTSIDERPVEVDERLVPGHWEGDLIKGKTNRSQVGTLVERTTLFTVLAQMEHATAACAAESFSRVLARVDSQMLRSLTYDQGREMAAHELFSRGTGMAVYFAHPHSPWERGINENTNGLLRDYLPKGSDLSVYTERLHTRRTRYHRLDPECSTPKIPRMEMPRRAFPSRRRF